ncbi:MAG: outer membrane beta-barrel domain-containing protein [Desulfomonilia bacterium]
MKQMWIAVIMVLLCLSGQALAENRDGAVGVTILGGWYAFDSDQDDFDNGWTYGAALGYNLDEHWGLEAMFNYVNSDDEGDFNLSTATFEPYEETSAMLYHLDGLYHFFPDKKLVPYLAAGLGAITFDSDREGFDTDTDFMVNYGGGLKYFITESLALRGDIRHVISFDETDHNMMYNLGLMLALGGEKKTMDSDGDGVTNDLDKCPNTPAGVAVDVNGCPKDSDGDGVPDYLDKCPNTPAGVKVDSSGCPVDSDGDGVPDYLDKCPNTPAGVKVDKNGCPVDSDGDGVPDYLDKCPGTPKGTPVDANGCPPVVEAGAFVFRNIYFDFDKADIKDESLPILDEVSMYLEENADMKMEIQGHTDSVGPDEYNMRLSQARAESVKDYLVNSGIGNERLVAKGFGETNPVAPNDTAENRAKNRRVEFVPIQ